MTNNERQIVLKNGRQFSYDPKSGRLSPVDIDPRFVQQTGLSPEDMAKKTEDNDNANSLQGDNS